VHAARQEWVRGKVAAAEGTDRLGVQDAVQALGEVSSESRVDVAEPVVTLELGAGKGLLVIGTEQV